MRRFLTHAFVLFLACCALLGSASALVFILAPFLAPNFTQKLPAPASALPALLHSTAFAAQKSPPPAAADPGAVDDERALASADHALEQSVADRGAFAIQTDSGFTWIDSTGTLQSRDEILDAFAAGNPPQPVVLATAVGAQLITRVYGRLGFVQVHAGRGYSLRVFAKRSGAWRALHVIDLTQAPQSAAPASATGAAVPSEEGVVTPCINPCKIAPFDPSTPGAKAAFAGWREMEQGSLTRNMDLWGRHVLDDVIIADSGGNGTITKAQRIANTLKQKQSGVRTNEVPPMLWARAFDFGDSVLLLMLQQPYKGQPYYGTRIYVNRDGRYQMAVSYHTAIASVPDFILAKQLPAK